MNWTTQPIYPKINNDDRLRKKDYYVEPACLEDGQQMVRDYHYAKGGSNTCVYMHGLYRKLDDKLVGVAWWLPPTKVAAQSINDIWWKVLSLTRLVILPDVPKNAASFLLSKSIKLIWNDNNYLSLVTYADEYKNHLGIIYKASNWTYVGKTGPYARWEDSNGKQVAQKATINRIKSKMLELGYVKVGSFYKHKYVLHRPE